MYKQPNYNLWSGRVDEQDGELGKRWHQKIESLEYPYNQKKWSCFFGF